MATCGELTELTQVVEHEEEAKQRVDDESGLLHHLP